MKRKSSKLMALALTLAAVCAMVTISASAATTYTPIGGSTTITKNLVVDSDANIPDVTFTYTITRGTAVAATSTTMEILSSTKTGTIGNAVYTNADTASAIAGLPTDADPAHPTEGKKYAQKSIAVTFDTDTFTKPGVYRFVIHEADGGKPGVTYDTDPRYLDVFVVADSDTNALSVDSYLLRGSETTIGTDGDYTSDPGVKSPGFTNSIAQFDFEFSKAITGNQGDKNQRFTFTLSISNAIPGTYPVTANDVTGNPTAITVANDGTYSGTYDLTNGSTLKVLGINSTAVCTVSEDNQDYTATHTVNSGSSVSGNNSGAITLDNNYSVAFTNTRDGVIPTGVLLTVAPFTIGLFLFGAAGVYFVARKRQFDED